MSLAAFDTDLSNVDSDFEILDEKELEKTNVLQKQLEEER